MRVVALDHRVVTWPLDGRGAARGRRTRTAILVELRTETGTVGLGEAAPLPELPGDTLDAARDAIAALAAALPGELDGPCPSPSARFAIETALLDARARELGVTMASLLGARPDATRPASAVVVDTPDEARAARASCLKVKVGPEGDADRVRAIAAAAPGARLRLDANRTWPRERVRAYLAALADLPVDFVEEPCEDAASLLGEPLALPLALDESLAGMPDAALDAALASPALAALVLKPTLLGGLAAAMRLGHRARAAGKAAIVTHALEGPVGTAACRELARALGGPAPAGLAPHPALAAWRIADELRGLDLDGLLARLDDPLVPAPRPRRASARPRVVVATPGPETVDAVHAALADRAPLGLVHPALPELERARQRAAVEAARLPADAAIVLFTSGSTARARGVVLSRAALLAAADASAAHLGWRPDDRWLVALSLAHAGGLAVVVRCLAGGRPIELAGPDLATSLARCTLASLVPTQLAGLLDDPAWRPPPGLRAVLLGGAAAPPALLARAADRGVPFLTTYGMTESFGQLATAPLERAGDPGAPLVALPGVELLGGTRLTPAPIRVRAPMLATCYLDGAPIAPELTTADLGFVEAGALHVVGRADDVIITGGENVHPATIEAVASATPGVRAALAFGIADERWGQVVGLAIEVDGAFDRAAALAAWHAALPPHARPRELAIVARLPQLATGKLDRRAAAALAREPVRYR